MSSHTKHNKGVLPARSYLLELGFQQPRSGQEGSYFQQVNDIAHGVLEAFGLSEQDVQCTESPRNAMIHQIPNQLRTGTYAAALQVISAPELWGDRDTIEAATAQAIRQSTRLFQQYGLSADAIKAGFTEVGREMTSTGSSSTR